MKLMIKKFFLNRKTAIFAVLSIIIPFIIYILTLEPKLIGGDTSWFALQILEMSPMVPTGYPVFSMLGKLFTFLPVGDIAFRLNLFSAVFGALTALVLFLALNRMTKNSFVSFISSMTFAFTLPFWEVANRLEFDTLHTFFLALVFFSAVLYNENRTRKYLYLFSFCWGLSLTNHPLAFFLVPAIVLYVIIIDPSVFKSARAILLSILYLILPLLSYLYIMVRSLQGHGQVDTPLKLFYYVTGRGVTGDLHGGRFGGRELLSVLGVIGDYLRIAYDTYGIILLIIALAGFVFLIRKNIKFALCTLLLVIMNITIPPLYAGYALRNYFLNSMIVFSFYIAFGMLVILDGAVFLFDRTSLKRRSPKVSRILRYCLVAVVAVSFILLPSCLILENYNILDRSEPEGVYKFWDEAFSNIESNSRVYVLAKSTNVGKYVNEYVYGEKDIDYIWHKDPESYTVENMTEDVNDGLNVYFVGNRAALKKIFNAEQVGESYYWEWQDEELALFKVIEPVANIEVSYYTDSRQRRFGESFNVEYTVRNKNRSSIMISSFELELPQNIEFIKIMPDGDIRQDPGLSRGMYMWVGDYIIEGESEINLIVELRGTAPGQLPVKFRLTTNDFYIKCDDIEIEIQD
jgi:hypothetical protein